MALVRFFQTVRVISTVRKQILDPPFSTLIHRPSSILGQSRKLNPNLQSYRNISTGNLFKPIIQFAQSFFRQRREAKTNDIRTKIELVNEQIQHLYGPLYGNRLVEKLVFNGVVGFQKSLTAYLKNAKENSDNEMIYKWRQFVWETLYPLDTKAKNLILKNAHLIEGQFPEEFNTFLRHYGKLCFVVQNWSKEHGKLIKKTNGDFLAEGFLERTNASGEKGLDDVLEHVKTKLEDLKKNQTNLYDQLYSDSRKMMP